MTTLEAVVATWLLQIYHVMRLCDVLMWILLHLNQVSRCIPYKLNNIDGDNQSCDLLDRVEVLMVTSPGRLDFVFPKGGWENDETAGEAACREALEEAGVRGTLNDTALGVWEFRSKSTQKACSLEGTCKGYMFALEVTEELDCYPEKDSRDRKWVPVGEAYKLCRYDWMRKALDSFKDLLRGRRIPTVPELSEPPSLCIVKPSAADHAIALC
uniref:Nudix hydrolase domain-containing protein n=1 Tax=Musa acuminata subsp. malaccensis TaxID=214687 RepID=A0A804JHG1_MUSAM|nr:PREDICTED: nudix hydrolase 13, mitochondrial isoform X2 [Musa acuminata subsp. malaccensis]